MRVLIACEESQVVCKAFRAVGHDAYSADLQACSGGKTEWHILGDVLDVLEDNWDMAIMHPPCTYLANSGVRWLYHPDGTTNRTRWEDMQMAANFFRVLSEQHQIPKVAIENPIPHGHAGLSDYTQLIQPWQFGDNYSKATCLWLKGLPPLVPLTINPPADIVHACHMEPPGPDRQRNRSKTYQGIADQMALQWGTDWKPVLVLGGESCQS